MWKTICPPDETSATLSGRVFSRIDPSNATVIYTAASFQKQPLGYYYSTRIGWDLYEIVGEIPEGILSCILAPDKYRSSGPAALSGQIRLGRHGIGRIRILDRQSDRTFLQFQSIGTASCWSAEALDDPSGAASLGATESGEFFRTEGGLGLGLRPRMRRTFQRLGSFTRPVPWLQESPELRAALLMSFAVLQGQSLFDLPRRSCV